MDLIGDGFVDVGSGAGVEVLGIELLVMKRSSSSRSTMPPSRPLVAPLPAAARG